MERGRGFAPLHRRAIPSWHARKESNPRPAVLETAAPPWLERERMKKGAQDVVRATGNGGGTCDVRSELPAQSGPAGIGGFPDAGWLLVIERLAGSARIRAEAPRGQAPEHFRGGEVA